MKKMNSWTELVDLNKKTNLATQATRKWVHKYQIYTDSVCYLYNRKGGTLKSFVEDVAPELIRKGHDKILVYDLSRIGGLDATAEEFTIYYDTNGVLNIVKTNSYPLDEEYQINWKLKRELDSEVDYLLGGVSL